MVDLHEVSSTLIHAHRPKRWGARIARIAGFGGLLAILAAEGFYSFSLRPEERGPFQQLATEVETYWSTLEPIFDWDAKARRYRGHWFLQHEVLPRRTTVLAIAREVSEVNEQALQEDERRVDELFAQFQRRLQIITALGLGVSLVLAALTVTYTLRLEKMADGRYQESLRNQNELKELSARLVSAQEGERRAISRELHDEVGQSLGALLMEVDNLAATLGPEAAFRERLDKMRPLVENCVDIVRNSSKYIPLVTPFNAG